MLESLLVQIINQLPKKVLSRTIGAMSNIQLPPPIQPALNEVLASILNIDRDESAYSPRQYSTFNDLFTRKLRRGVRPIESRKETEFVSPVDGTLTRFGQLSGETLFEIKESQYDIRTLLDSGEDAATFRNGSYAVFYLSPRNYHRIHSPARCRVHRLRYLPGYLFPVNPIWVRHVDNLFGVNERLISFLKTETNRSVAFVKIGATCVGRITLSFQDFETTDHNEPRKEISLQNSVHFEHGDEFGVFNLGSTVVMLIEGNDFEFAPWLSEGQSIQMGGFLGSFEKGVHD